MNWFKRILSWLVNLFWHIQDVYRELKPCRFSFIIAILGALVFLKVDQGTEVLRALAEPGGETGATGGARLGLFAVGLFLWSVASWYTARVLLYLTERWQPPRAKGGKRFHGWLRCQAPRILGVAPLFIVGWSFLSARKTYESDPPARLFNFGLAAIVVGVLLYAFFVWRRRRLDLRNTKKTDEQETSTLMKLEWESHVAIGVMGFISFVLTVLFVVNPVLFAGRLGTGAVLMFAAASWVFWGSALVYLGGLYRLPILTFLAIWIAICSLSNDNHAVCTLPRDEMFQRENLRNALINWHTRIAQKYPDRPVHPLFIVAAEGGGIRAAYWTASVLGSIQDVEPAFADHVFAISGVSGGSVGAAVFGALIADATPPGKFAERAEMMLGRDFLSPAIAAMLYPDFLQRFWPCPITYLDRGRWLEKSWEKAWFDITQTDRFAQRFFDLWKNPEPYVPALFLNGTSVENGNRLIVSNVLIDGDFLSADDAATKLMPRQEDGKAPPAGIDLPLSTAAHFSARFTYVSPAGRFESDGKHVVDGGYFENSGATTALDILREVSRALSKENGLGDVLPKIIMISNNPLGAGTGDIKAAAATPALKEEAKRHEPGTFLEDALAPLYALLSTRDARGVYAQAAIGKAQDVFYEKLSTQPAATETKKVYFFSLAPAKVPLPLGWMLSNGAAEAMQQQLNDQGKSAKTKVETWNKEMREQIVASIGGHVP